MKVFDYPEGACHPAVHTDEVVRMLPVRMFFSDPLNRGDLSVATLMRGRYDP